MTAATIWAENGLLTRTTPIVKELFHDFVAYTRDKIIEHTTDTVQMILWDLEMGTTSPKLAIQYTLDYLVGCNDLEYHADKDIYVRCFP